jgi:hypothetical protein
MLMGILLLNADTPTLPPDDITAFTSACAHLYSHITKPILDATLISLSLAQVAPPPGPGSTLPQLSRAQQSNATAGPLIAATVVFSTGRLLRSGRLLPCPPGA